MNSALRRRLIYILPLPVLFGSLLLGPSASAEAWEILVWLYGLLFRGASEESLVGTIVWEVRLPRILLTFLVGGALAASGNALQAMFRNPLVAPYILGLSSGAAFGAAIALVLPFLPLQPTAFGFGLLAVGLAYFLARTRKTVSVVSLILSGVIVTGIFTALLTIVQFLTDPYKLQTIVHWTMGNLHNSSWAKLYSAAPGIGIGVVWLFLFRWRMNVLAQGDEEARAVGLNPERERVLILIPATLAASAAIAVAGVIGMIGLAVPHMVRMMLGPDNRHTLPAAFAFGGAFLLLVDTCSRTLASFEIPVGVFTTLLGGPFFIFLLKKTQIGWET
ncbi:MAG: iron ABC transporter permease [Gemmatimonadota bacterium]|nr:iron ABC transporter permease [Gemmatimonadota bacterium]